MAFKVGSFVAPVPGTGTFQDVDVGFRPDFVLFFHGNQTSASTTTGFLSWSFTWAGDPAIAMPYQGEGFAPHVFPPGLFGSPIETYNYDSIGNWYSIATAGVANFTDSGWNNLGFGLLSAFYANGFTIQWDPSGFEPVTDSFIIYYLAIDDIDNFYVDQEDYNVTVSPFGIPAGSHSVTGLGFKPNFLLGWDIYNTSVFSGGIFKYTQQNSIGFVDDKLNQFAICHKNGFNVDVPVIQNTTLHGVDLLVQRIGDLDTEYTGQMELTSFDPDGFTLNTSYSGGGGPFIFGIFLDYFALKINKEVLVGSFDMNTATGMQSITGLGVAPECLILTYSGCGETSAANKSQYGIGVVDTNLDSFCFCAESTDTPQYGHKFSDTTCIETGVLSTEYSAEIVSLDSDGFTINILQANVSPAPTVRFVAFGTASAAADFFRRIEGMEMPPKETHYMSVPHATAGIAKSAWTINLYKQGERVTDVPVDVVENPDGHYTFSFVNDGEHEKIWNLTAYPTATPTSRYAQSWIVKKRITESTVKYLRSKADSESGFFKSNVNKDS